MEIYNKSLVCQNDVDTLFELLISVRNMRETQKEYFKTRDKNVLMSSKAIEKEVDTLIVKCWKFPCMLELNNGYKRF